MPCNNQPVSQVEWEAAKIMQARRLATPFWDNEARHWLFDALNAHPGHETLFRRERPVNDAMQHKAFFFAAIAKFRVLGAFRLLIRAMRAPYVRP